jgi:hypothetical protein
MHFSHIAVLHSRVVVVGNSLLVRHRKGCFVQSSLKGSLSRSKGTIPRDVDDDLPGCGPPRPHRIIRRLARPLFKESIRLFFRIVGPVALAQFALGFIPECVFVTLGPAGRLPQLVGAGADLLNGRDAHLRTHKPSWPKSQRRLPQLVPLRTRSSGPFAH